jgi:multidrug efflux pump
MSVSLIAVFIPLLLMGGIVGRLLREFAVTLSVAISVSMVVSLTATPMMCAHLLKGHESHGWVYNKVEDGFNWVVGLYGKTLSFVLRHAVFTLLVLLTTIGLNVYLFLRVPKGFFPQQDTGRMGGQIIADQDTSFQAMDKTLLQMVNIVAADPGVDTVNGFTGGGGGGGGGASTLNQGRMFISLKPLAERKITVDLIMQRLRPKLARIPGATLYLQSSQDLRVGGRNSAAMYQFTMRGDNLQDLIAYAPKMLQELKTIPTIVDVNSDQQNRGLQSMVTYDRDTAARFGISPQLIDNTLYDAFGQRQVSTMYKSLNQYHVVMEAAPQYWQNPLTLRDIFVHAPNGKMVPLSAIAHYAPAVAPLSVNHQGLFPCVTISFNLQPGVALGDAILTIDEASRKVGLPNTIQTGYTGTAAAYTDSLSNEKYLIAAALAAVYLMLGILYESYIHPVTILSTLPSAGVGAFLALILTKTDLSIISMIGIILLIGLVKKNGILIVDFAMAAERIEHKSPRDAIFEASLLRFRPILMTTFAAMLGALPLALGTGTGSELRRPLGITIIGGLLMSQALTLFTTPVVYLYFDRWQHWWSRIRGVQPSEPLEPIGSEG